MIGFWPRLPSMHTSRRDSPILRHHYYYLPIHLAIVDIRPHPIQTQKASSERRGLQCGFLRPLILQKYLLSELAPGDVSISPPLPTVATNQSTTPGSAELDNSGCRGFTGPFPPPLWMSVHQYELVDVIIARVSGLSSPPASGLRDSTSPSPGCVAQRILRPLRTPCRGGGEQPETRGSRLDSRRIPSIRHAGSASHIQGSHMKRRRTELENRHDFNAPTQHDLEGVERQLSETLH